ncbi:MAG: hypothetical protein HY820_03200 [Acidobacteria bacterium]|nr:hypothetical protein [Acidobacteriota bacterium]
MFERYTDQARRVIFFARYEASQFGAEYIASEHLLLGMVREDPFLKKHIDGEAVRKAVKSRAQPKTAATTSLDIPLNMECKRILVHAAQEADRRNSMYIHPAHMLAGILMEQASVAAQVLGEVGFRVEMIEPQLASIATRTPPVPSPVPEIGPLARELAAQVALTETYLLAISEYDAGQMLKRRNWTRKQALGHLIDLATAHHQWIARALVEPRVAAVSYPEQEWTTAQNYEMLPWAQLLELWLQLNQLLVHVLGNVPESRHEIPIKIGIAPPVPLREIAATYAAKVEEVAGEILTRG